ncbi:alpha/beta fold hydrolase [Anaeromyxobacter sp. Fw109-5]|uniref:alpha/beta fold hydrolase n=1 Tax=Anaeromyxobacter sp. (strain Fw109-5) TaxID=404589 RepID=UPI0002F19F69|nr:alpha/beta hydrolase [Anaeromyxobacter sp. Fw109-5]
MEKTEHRATALDGTRLHWTSAGAGGPAVVLCDGIGCAGYVWRALEPLLARERRVLHWNYRAHGRSAAPSDPERMTVDDCVSDLLAVLEAAGEERAVLAGHSMGVQVALELQRRHPDRVAGLLLLCGAPGHLLDTFHDSSVLRYAFPWAKQLVLRYPDLARLAFRTVVPTDFALSYAMTFEVDGARVRRADLERYLEDLSEVDPALFVRLLASAEDHDTRPHLPHVTAPTLVVAGERDSFTPLRLSEAIHHAIPGSELLVVPGGTHVAPLEDPELVGERTLAFLGVHAPVRRPRRAGATAATAATAAGAAASKPRRRAAKADGVASAPRARRPRGNGPRAR